MKQQNKYKIAYNEIKKNPGIDLTELKIRFLIHRGMKITMADLMDIQHHVKSENNSNSTDNGEI